MLFVKVNNIFNLLIKFTIQLTHKKKKGTEKALGKINLSLEDPHDVGGVFKLYFRSLPEPLCTYEKYSKFKAIQGNIRYYYYIFCEKNIIY